MPNDTIESITLPNGTTYDLRDSTVSEKADKADTVLTTTLSRGRLANTTVGQGSFAFGYDVAAPGMWSHAEGYETTADGHSTHAEGFQTLAYGAYTHAEGFQTVASGECTHAEGRFTRAHGISTHVFGDYNVENPYVDFTQYDEWTPNTQYNHQDVVKRSIGDKPLLFYCIESNTDEEFDEAKWMNISNRKFVEIVGNGKTNEDIGFPRNARALDWDGNEYLCGDLYVNCHTDSSNGVKVAKDIPMTGASSSTDGISGLVPAPSSGDQEKFLRGDGTWATQGTAHYAWADITGKPESFPPESHTHGNITNAGALQTSDITIANGDKLVVTDSSDSEKVARTSISFDGSTTTQCLTKKGTWASFTNNAGTVTSVATGAGLTGGTITSSGTISISGMNTSSGSTAKCLTEKGTWASFTNNAGTVTSVATGAGLTGGTITSSGTISISGMNTSSGSTSKCLTEKGTWASFTNNAGTVTGVKINGSTKSPSSGTVDIGTVTVPSDLDTTAVSSPVTWNTTNCDSANSSVSVYKSGNVREVRVQLKYKGSGTGWKTLATLSSGNRPKATTYFVAYYMGEAKPQLLNINTSGEIRMYGNTSTTTTIYGIVTFLV